MCERRNVGKYPNSTARKEIAFFGGGYLLSANATARKIKAYKQAAQQATKQAAQQATKQVAQQAAKQAAAIVWKLSEREQRIIAELE